MARIEAKARPRPSWLRFVALAALFFPAHASAGAWVAEDETQEIWTTVAGERAEGRFVESAVYLEAPLSDDVALVVSPWTERNDDTIDGWRAEALLGLKRSLFEGEATAISLQAGAIWMSHPPLGCAQSGGELRWLLGRSLGEGFLSVEAGRRFLSGGCERDRAELTLGYQPHEQWLGLGQVFYESAPGRDESVKLQLSLVRRPPWGRGLQIGLRGRIDGGPAEPALVLALWSRPAD